MREEIFSVRQVQESDFEKIVDYFLNADGDFLITMGVDISNLPSKEDWLKILSDDLQKDLKTKRFFYIIWLLNDEPIGHCNINKIIFGKEAFMHLHIWKRNARKNGMGFDLLKMTLPYYFKLFQLQYLFCEPSALNPAPNKILEKTGFEFMKQYDTIPGWINFHQTVNCWQLPVAKFEELYLSKE
jgi:RimJ/RimL family protein N-acetyltransferase